MDPRWGKFGYAEEHKKDSVTDVQRVPRRVAWEEDQEVSANKSQMVFKTNRKELVLFLLKIMSLQEF